MKNRIIGKHALMIGAKGKTEFASQIFVYDKIREIRFDYEKSEIKLLMSYDESYFRVFDFSGSTNVSEEQKKDIAFKFYNNLVNATMKFTKEDLENMKKQREKIMEQINSQKNSAK